MSSPAISAPTLQLTQTLPLPSAQNIFWQGRLCSIGTEKIKSLSRCIRAIAYTIFFPLNLIFANTWATSSVCKKLTQNVLPMFEQLKGLPNHYAKLKTVLGSTFTIINSIQIAEDAHYFVLGKFKNQSPIGISAKVMLSIGHTMEGVNWLSRIGLISSQPLGNLRIFRLANNKIINVLSSTLAFTPALFAADTLFKIPAAANDAMKKALMLELAKHLGELTLSLMMLAGRISAVSLGAVGLTCIGLEILNLIYKERYENTRP